MYRYFNIILLELLCVPSILLILQTDAFLPSIYQSPIHKPTKLCGIKGFRSWFESAFPSAVTTITPESNYPSKRSNRQSNDNNKNCQPEVFDHVLIDANQFLHTSLRKAYNRRATRYKESVPIDEQEQLDADIVEHCLLLFLREINRITTTTAVPRKSLVVALDGSPSAAKLEMQRSRRYSIYNKAENQERQIEVLKQRGWRDSDFNFSGGRKKLSLFGKHERNRVTLNITPGTAFMDRVTDALLYWAWQRLTRQPRVRVYISPSSVHGEGEVKLLDWITHGHELSMPKSRKMNIKQNETVAILGGDSDLVLMGLVVPPSITHNIHVILPGERGKSMVASVWQTTRMMARMIEGTATYGTKRSKKSKIKRKRQLSLNEINQARIDTTLLIIMNGNDYLPKLRGCRGGFDTFFKIYINLVKQWIDRKEHVEGDSFLINFDSMNNELYLNVPFAIAFFKKLANDSDTVMPYKDRTSEDGSPSSQSELGSLNNLVEAKILPGPLSFETINPEDSAFKQEVWEMKSKLNHSTIFEDGVEIVRLALGNYFPEDCQPFSTKPDKDIFNTVLGESDGHGVISRMIRRDNSTKSSGGRAYIFEVPHRSKRSMKATKVRLARLALEDIFGIENLDSLFSGGNVDDDDDDYDNFQKPGSASADVKMYIAGLLWNLETYQHGCCVDYGYDYGRSLSPSPLELVDFLEDLERNGTHKLKSIDLIGEASAGPISDGLSCLAAVPPQAWHLVPEPYSWLVETSRSDSFEELYSSCFDNETNRFDIQSFEKKVDYEIQKMKSAGRKVTQTAPSNGSSGGGGRQIYFGNKFWTVFSLNGVPLTHPFQPPLAFCDKVRTLRRNNKLRVTKFPVKSIIKRGIEFNSTDTSGDLDQQIQATTNRSILEIPYKTAFR